MYRVLIADDESFILDGLKVIIDWEEYGLEIAGQASNGITALELLKQSCFHILITDIKMPYMDGIELVNKIRQEELNIKIIILSGYDDFEYVREAVKLGIENYLLKPINEEELSSTLLNTVEKIEGELHSKTRQRADLNIIKTNILHRWITGSISDKDLLDRAELLGIDLNNDFYLICLLRVLETPEYYKSISPSGKNDLVVFAACNIFEETLGLKYDHYIFPSLNDDIVIILPLDLSKLEMQEIITLLKRCIRNITNCLHIDIFLTVGRIIKGFQALCRSYKDAVELMDYSLVLPSNSIAEYEAVIKTSTELPKEIKIMLNLLKESIISMDQGSAKMQIDDIYTKLRTQGSIHPKYVRNITVELLSIIYNSANKQRIHSNADINYPEILYSKAFEIKSISELTSLVKNAAENAVNTLISIKSDQNPVIDTILNYIKDNYSDDLSLKIISSKFNINSAYLGQLFRNETGEFFTNYLNKIRMDEAKQLLSDTKLTIAEVAERVGYPNTKYFYSLFKKITGIYPSDYKRKHIINNQ